MMLTQMVFEWVLTSAFLILAVMALRALLGKRVSAGLRYALWAVVLVRLLVPGQLFSLPVPAVFPETAGERGTEAVPPAIVAAAPGVTAGTPAIAGPIPDGTAVNYDLIPAPAAPKAGPLGVLQVLGWAWLGGSAVMALVLSASNLQFFRKLRRARLPLEDADGPLPVYIAQNLPSPCLFGLVRPAVYVTPETAADPDMLRHVLAHEYTHYRHGDHVWNALRSITLAVHWWNPLVWLAVVLSRRDCELACDEGALHRLGDGERIAYGRTLLALLTQKPRPRDLLTCATTMTGGQKSVFERVTRIAHAPKRLVRAAVAAVLVTALAGVCAFGSAADYGSSAPSLDGHRQADLNRDGVPEDLRLVSIDGGVGWRLELWENDEMLWSEEWFNAHAGWAGLFLCTLDGEDYLLRYTPTMYGGICDYTYTLFTLSEDGEEQTAKEKGIQFDTNMGTPVYTGNFDPETIAAFMDEINGLLSHSVQLLNTDENLAATFEKEGRLYDSLWWLDGREEFTRDPSQSLLENLREFRQAMEGNGETGLDLWEPGFLGETRTPPKPSRIHQGKLGFNPLLPMESEIP